MSIPVHITNRGTGETLRVGNENGIAVTLNSHPNLQEIPQSYPFAAWFENDAGSNDMRVNGSVTPQVFSIKAVSDRDIFIKTIDLVISDGTVDLANFGDLAALTNGMRFEYSTPKTGDIVIQDNMKTNISMIRLFSDTPPLGTDSSAFRAGRQGGVTSFYLMKMDVTKMFGYHWGLRLQKGDTARLSFIVRDDLSAGLTDFNVKAYGIQI